MSDSVKKARDAAAYLTRAIQIIETGDARLMANDGPCGGLPPDISLAEWREMYVALCKARASLPAERREAARAAINRTLEWAEELCTTLTASGSLSEWLDETYPEGET